MWRRLKRAWKLAGLMPTEAQTPDWTEMDSAQLRQFLTASEAGKKYLIVLRNTALEQMMKCATEAGHDKALYANGVAAGAVVTVGVVDDLSQMHT